MENNHDIDKTFNEASKSLEEPVTFPGFDKVWAKVEEKLDQREERKHKRIPAWLPYGIAASLLIASGIFYFTSTKDNNTTIDESVIAKNTVGEKISSPQISEQIRKTDSVVKVNIQKQIVSSPAVKLARNETRKSPVASLMPPAYEIASASSFDKTVLEIREERAVMDSIKRNNIEEVIAMGIKKEKASMNALASSKKISDLNKIADTADYEYQDLTFGHREKLQEPEILSKKSSAKEYKPLASNSVKKTLLGEKQSAASLNGFTPGLSINSISGATGSGRVDISVGYQTNSKTGAEPLVLIDGAVSDIETLKKIAPSKIDNISVISKEKAGGLFDGKAKNGLIVVITKDISKTEKQRLKKLLEEKVSEK
ncbi:SusC/RagA family TonB-linked outer membrane protein [Chryseobacterium cheonjiense]|uniref:TonB-dependent receptor plug domain-containing protein n=1 Tax=Chryseobacterium cheonjiense TaxID=2728845 RepID=A0A7Y0FKK4_9FLAO|nr:hypothetical protein [Chryseobacterium cheonjiense]NML59425.1 hypothetical protein [Chryseobacterium cheonjiense]